MRLRFALVGLLLLATSGPAARADSLVYDLTGSPFVTGTVTVDSLVGNITGSALTITTSAFTDHVTGAGGVGFNAEDFVIFYGTRNDYYELLLVSPHDDGTLKGYVGGSFRFLDLDRVAETSGLVVPQVPEPGSLWLLGTGALGLLGVPRRRGMGRGARSKGTAWSWPCV